MVHYVFARFIRFFRCLLLVFFDLVYGVGKGATLRSMRFKVGGGLPCFRPLSLCMLLLVCAHWDFILLTWDVNA